MNQDLVNQINGFSSYRYDSKSQRVVNLKLAEASDIDEFLEVQYILDSHRISYRFEKNFQILVLAN